MTVEWIVYSICSLYIGALIYSPGNFSTIAELVPSKIRDCCFEFLDSSWSLLWLIFVRSVAPPD